MDNFITKIRNIEIASSELGVRVTDQYSHINGETLLEKFRTIPTGQKDGSHFLRKQLEINKNGQCMSRSENNMEHLASLLIIDCDKQVDHDGQEIEGAPDPKLIHEALKNNNIGHVIYGSHSHYTGTKGNRYRIILVTSRPYNKEELPATIEACLLLINQYINDYTLAYAKENNVFAQAWYYPRCPRGNTFEHLYFEHLEGLPVPVAVIDKLPPISHVATNTKQQCPDGKISPIQAFNQQNRLTDLLSRYNYKRKLVTSNHEKWLSPESSSGIAGITVKDNKFFSHHNDQFSDNYWHDAFDLMRVREGLSEHDALIKASKETIAPDGRSVDNYNKNLFNKNKSIENKQQPLQILFEPYQAFDNELLPVDSVPYEALPDILGDFVQEQSLIRGCPDDYILVSLLARMGCVFSGKIQIALTRKTGWHASPNFFWAMIGDPSAGKSNALSATNKPIQLLSEEARKKYGREIKKHSQDVSLIESKITAAKKGLEAEGKKAKADSSVIARFEELFKTHMQELAELEERKPKLKRYTVTKVTVEKLILILEENPEGVMLEVDELSSSFVRLSKDDNADERGLYLSGFNGGLQYPYDTVKRGTVFIPRLLLSIFGGIQPSKLKRFLNEARIGYQDDGMLQRFQGIVYPDKNTKKLEDRPATAFLVNRISELFFNLDCLPTEILLSFNSSAQQLFDEWRNETSENAQLLGHPYEAHLVKSYEFVAALAVYLYLAENNGKLNSDEQITSKQILSAIKLGSYFFSHAKRMYGLVYKDHLPARSLSEKLAKLVGSSATKNEYFDPKAKLFFFTRSQIRSKDWADLTTQEERREAIKILVQLGHISKANNNRYYINPIHLNE